MLKAVLFDLDDTLLGNSMDTFLPAYFQALTRYLDHLIPPERLIAQLMRATKAMDANHNRHITNEEAFASAFYPALKPDRSTLERHFQHFYVDEFPKLKSLTRRRREARSLVEWALGRGIQVAVATNPLFPRVAVEQRLAWAGVPVDDFGYALVTTYENMRATKSHPAYYREILSRLGRRCGECLMVGDSWEMDVLPASSVGLQVYWVTDEAELPSQDVPLAGRGSLGELWATVTARGSLPGEYG
jgi:FMN phosphatase YigB (HAD superfamily)